MRGAILFAAGLFVGLAVSVGMAQNANSNVVMMNHVGINVPDIPDAMTYYTETMGYREAFRLNDDNGQPRLVYVQISENTFVELQPARGRPEGVSHFGLHVEDMEAATAMFKQRGAEVSEIRDSDTGAILSNITELNGLRIELAELPPESQHRQAMNRWR